MHARQVYSWVVATVLIGAVLAAPFREAQKEKRDATPEQKVADQESQLENLVSLAGEKTKGNNVAVHESHVSHIENKNGKEIKTEETEEKVTDTETGKVLADVKQVSETGTDGKGEPKKVTETKVDIPDEGVHESFVKEDDEETEMQPLNEAEAEAEAVRANIEMSPTRVAQELVETFDFDNFYAALKDLVDSSVMTKKEAAAYKEQVISEYQRLMAEQSAMEASLMSEDPAAYYPVYEEPEMKRADMGPLSEQIPDNVYGAYEGYLPTDLGFDRKQIMGEMNGEEESLSNIIDALLNAWWEKDFEGGNARALALVSYLDDIVSRDNNPDDIGQIRDILADMLADALLDDVQNAETEYKMEQAVEEAAPVNTQSEESTEESPAPAEENSEEENPEEELKEVAQEADKTAEDETPEAPTADSTDETAEEEKEKKAGEEKH